MPFSSHRLDGIDLIRATCSQPTTRSRDILGRISVSTGFAIGIRRISSHLTRTVLVIGNIIARRVEIMNFNEQGMFTTC